MSSRLDEILDAVIKGALTAEDACRALSAAARANPPGAQLWPMLIEARVTLNHIPPALGRVFMEALEVFEPEKTMWLAPPSDGGKTARAGGDVAGAPMSKSQASLSPSSGNPPPIHNAEQLRAFLWGTNPDGDRAHDRRPASGSASLIPTLAPPPRSLPGVTQPLPPLDVGTVLKNRYRLEAHLGFGGIGQVFSAVDLDAERQGKRDPRLTLKVIAVDLKREPHALMAMKIAVAKIKSLRHRNIVTTYGIETDNDRLFVTMEPLFGRWLGERIRAVRAQGVSQDVAWPIVEGIAKGLSYAHAHGIVHSDLSPYAVFLTEDGTPKIMGFGLIHALPTSNEAMDLLDTMTLRAYSEAYTANAWATYGTPDPADDLYPLGVIAYELLTGRHPFQRCNLMVARQRHLSAPPIAGLKRRAAKLIANCLSFERKERPRDATGFLARMRGPFWLRVLLGDWFSGAAAR